MRVKIHKQIETFGKTGLEKTYQGRSHYSRF
jgi:hypothetical protein